MLVPRLLSKLLPLSVPLRLAQGFAVSSSASYPLQAKIFATKSFDEFCHLYERAPTDISADVVAAVSRHIISLVSARDQRVPFDRANAFLASLEKGGIASLSEKTLVSLLSILRSLRIKGLSSPALWTLKAQLVGRYCELVREKRAEELDISDLAGAYNEMVFFRAGQECRLLAGKIMRVLDESVAQGHVALSTAQISYLLHCLSLRSELSSVETRIREVLLRRVIEQLASIKLYELVRIAVSLNRMDFFEFSGEEFSQVRLISQRIVENVTDLEESSIFDFVRGEFNSKFNGFFRVYEEINNNLFAEISEKGKVNIEPEVLIRMLAHLADKIPLERLPEPSQRKFFLLLQNYAAACQRNSAMAKGFGFRLEALISNGYFSGQHRQQVVDILSNSELPINTELLYELATRGYDLTRFTGVLASYSVPELREEILLKVGIIAHRMASQGCNMDELVAQAGQRVAAAVASPQEFIEFSRRLGRLRVGVQDFHAAFGKAVEQLPNPFLAPDGLPGNYRSIYFSYMHQALRSREFFAFTQTHDAAITLDDFSALVSHHFYQEEGKGKRMELNRSLLHFATRKVHAALETKHKRSIEVVIELLNKYSRFAVGGTLDPNSEAVLFRTLHLLLSRLDVLAEVEAGPLFFSMLEHYLTRNHKRYNIEAQYRSLIKHILTQLGRIEPVRRRIVGVAISAALRLNILSRQAIENISLEEIKNIGFFDRCRASYIKDQSFTPQIDRISQSTLLILFSNANLESLLIQNEKKIFEILKVVNPKDLCNYLTLFAAPKTTLSRRILSEILNNFLERVKSFERMDLTGVFHNALENNFFHFSQYKKLAEKAIEEYRQRMGHYSVDSHLELIKFITSQPGLAPREYYRELADYTQRRDEPGQHDAVLVRLATTNHLFKDEEVGQLERITRKSLPNGLFYFLMLEERIEPALRSKFVTDFSKRFAELVQEGSQTTINSSYYQYIKKKYPEETASLTLTEKNLNVDRLSIKTKDEGLINTIVQLAGGSCEELTEFGPNNYFLKIKDCVIAFFALKRTGSFYEHEFIKRAVSTIRGEELKTILIHISNNHAITLDYIRKTAPTLFNEEEFQKTIQLLRQEDRKSKEQKKSEARDD